jgi:2-polyprenyl-3-methyl-5-hydroxy-6-metoxy-1,4-benzoquinol methylase
LSRYLHKLPAGRAVNREAYLLEAARGRSVIHVGFTDHPLLDERIEQGTWLHSRLATGASSIVGLDVDEKGVEWAKQRGYHAHAVDATNSSAVKKLGLHAEVVIAGEVIEHVNAPGPFLRAMLLLGDRLIVTTPNALRILNTFVPLTGQELVHADHVAWYSPTTLRRLLETSGWHVDELLYYRSPADELGEGRTAQKLLANVARRVAPRHLSDGLIANSSPAH